MTIGTAIVDRGVLVAGPETARIVPWWSFTKTVIAAAALTLVRDGRWALDAPLGHHEFTLRQVLSHRAGFGDYGALGPYRDAVARGDDPWPAEAMLERAGDAARPGPAGAFRYSNIGYLHVRRAIVAATGLDFGSALRRLVLDPLAIAHARLALTPGDLADVAMGAAYHPGWVYHGLLVGPLGEAALLLDRLLDGALLPRSLLAAMAAPLPVGGPIVGRPWRAPAYGLGLMIDAPEGRAAIAGHTGGGPGSVVAVYRVVGTPTTRAAFAQGRDEGIVERIAFGQSD